MGAFDGYWGGYGGHRSYGDDTITVTRKTYQYFDHQSSFEFFEGFEMPELIALLVKAEQEGSDTVWVPEKRGGSSGKGLKIWYVRALIKEYRE